MEKILVLVLGVAAIAWLVWWFFAKHTVDSGVARQKDTAQEIDIEVAGGYSPERVTLKKGIPAVLNFTRTDPSACLDQVVLADFGITQSLPQGEKVAIQIDTKESGQYQWSCGMDMFHGQIIIK